MRKLTIALLVISFQYACSKKTSDGTGGAAAGGACVSEVVPEAPAASGQLAFLLDATIDPCSVSGYIVGYQDDLKVKLASDGSYFVNNIPPGEHDVIITGTLLVSALAVVSATDKAVRLSDEKFLAGIKKEKGKVELPTVGSITGKVTLAGKTDHAGIHVYIPGTSYDATTNTDGSYTIAPFVPSGVNNLFFEKDGYHRGQIEGIKVAAGNDTSAPEIQLALSTGAEGFIIISGGAGISTSRLVKLTIGSTGDAVLMKISESPTFNNKSWEGVVSSSTYTFDSEGNKKLYIKFANENGLESSPFDDTITVDLFGDTEGTFTINSGASSSTSRTVSLAINVPQNAKNMMFCENSSFTGCSWEVATSTKSYVFGSDGSKTLYAKYKDVDGYESPIISTSVIVDTTAPSFTVQPSFTGRGNVTWTINATDISSMLVRYGVPSALDLATWTSFTGTLSLPYSTLDLAIQLKDNLGNIASAQTYSTPTYTPTLSQMRYYLAATKVSTKVFFAGGWYNSNYSNVVDIYDSAANSGAGGWSTSILSQARASLAATTIGTKAMFAGGEIISLGSSNVVDIYDSAANSGTGGWSTATLSQGRAQLAATTIGTKAIFAGGRTSTAYLNTVDIYDSSANSGAGGWSTATLSEGRFDLVATTVGTKAIFAGGHNGSGYSNVIDIYDSAANSGAGGWSTATLSQARSYIAVTVVGTKAIFAGGSTSDSTQTSIVDIYDSAANSGAGGWSTANLSQVRRVFAATTVGTKAIFAGGSATNSADLTTVDIYDSAANSGAGGWSTSILSQARSYRTAISFGTKAFFVPAESSAIDIYDSSTDTWSTEL